MVDRWFSQSFRVGVSPTQRSPHGQGEGSFLLIAVCLAYGPPVQHVAVLRALSQGSQPGVPARGPQPGPASQGTQYPSDIGEQGQQNSLPALQGFVVTRHGVLLLCVHLNVALLYARWPARHVKQGHERGIKDQYG